MLLASRHAWTGQLCVRLIKVSDITDGGQLRYLLINTLIIRLFRQDGFREIRKTGILSNCSSEKDAVEAVKNKCENKEKLQQLNVELQVNYDSEEISGMYMSQKCLLLYDRTNRIISKQILFQSPLEYHLNVFYINFDISLCRFDENFPKRLRHFVHLKKHFILLVTSGTELNF